jgi:restriction system protein
MPYEQRISHQGLNAFRVVRGSDPSEVDIKAKLQVKIWNQKWEKLQEAQRQEEKKKATIFAKDQKKQLALRRTDAAEKHLDALSKLLSGSLVKDYRLNWDDLKDKAPFPTPQPQQPQPVPTPRRPLHGDTIFQPQLGFFDKILSSRKMKKFAEQLQRFQAAEAQWKKDAANVQTKNDVANVQFNTATSEWNTLKIEFLRNQELSCTVIDKKKIDYEAKVPSAIIEYCNLILERSEYPDNFPRSCLLDYLAESKTLITEYDLPPVTALPTLKEVKYNATKDEFTESYVTSAWLHRTYDQMIYQIVLRTVNELFRADSVEALDSIVFNGWVTSIDKATGKQATGCIVTVQALKVEFMEINLALAEPRACFKKLKGISASTLADLTPVRPILNINREDKRFTQAYGVADSLDDSSNLAAMDWEDFENLIREVFEKEFSKGGGEVKITRASRDGGVDAVVFDPDPIRGGKIVIQAKRYTNTVGVSAVRDLYGTLLNEGANKGILVTTADYGPDAYDFAKDKPLTLLNGNELLYLLARHGHRAKINISEARQILGERAKET